MDEALKLSLLKPLDLSYLSHFLYLSHFFTSFWQRPNRIYFFNESNIIIYNSVFVVEILRLNGKFHQPKSCSQAWPPLNETAE